VLVSALHVLRPLFPGREPLIAAALGLVHGLAFARTLSRRELGTAQLVWTLLGFNTGIELAQVGLLALVAPLVLVLARTRAYGPFRLGAGGLGVLLSLSWLAESQR
jgi:uncharacterized membrane protein (UPF0136 family)